MFGFNIFLIKQNFLEKNIALYLKSFIMYFFYNFEKLSIF